MTNYGSSTLSSYHLRMASAFTFFLLYIAPMLFNLYTEYIMRNAGLEEAQAGIKIALEISITLDMQMAPPLWQKLKRN